LGPTIGNSIVIPHIKGVPVIGAFGVIIDGILRHLLLLIARAVEKKEFPGRFVDNIAEKGGKVGSG